METKFTVSFEIYNTESVKRLQEEDPDILPSYSVDAAQDLVYNKKQISAAITAGIIQGKSIDHIADDLQSRIETMNRVSAIRTARTAITNAQNAGTLASMKRLAALGVEVQKEWMATLDSRTRESHRNLDGERRELDERFSNGLMYPGASGSAKEVYNCRCTMVSYLPKYDSEDEPRVTYSEWTEYKKATGSVSGKISGEEYSSVKIWKQGKTRASGVYQTAEGQKTDAKNSDVAISNNTLKDLEKWTIEYREYNGSVNFTKDSLPNVYTYTTSAYRRINGYLREIRKLVGQEKAEMDAIVSGISTEMRKTALASDIVCVRGVDSIAYMTGSDSSFAAAKTLIGKTYKDKGFVSTSAYKGGGFDGIKMEITVPKETACIYCEDFSCYKGNNEYELLLDKGTTFEITDVVGDELAYTIKMRVVSQGDK